MNSPARLLVICLVALGACTALPAQHPPVPPLPAENVPPPPRSRTTLIWQPGHYDWDGRNYFWIAGSWVERAGHGVLWQDGYWRQTPRGSEWVPPHWM